MIYFIRYSLICCLFTFQIALAQEKSIEGFWDFEDYDMELIVDCECTPEQLVSIKKEIASNLKTELDFLFVANYLEFEDENTFDGIFGDDEIEGWYEQESNIITTHSDDRDNTFELISEDGVRKLVLRIDDDFLSRTKSSFESEEVGLVQLQLSELSIYFTKMFEDFEDELNNIEK